MPAEPVQPLVLCAEPPRGVGALRLRGRGGRWLRLSWRAAPAAAQYRAQCAPAGAPRAWRACDLALETPPPHRCASVSAQIRCTRL